MLGALVRVEELVDLGELDVLVDLVVLVELDVLFVLAVLRVDVPDVLRVAVVLVLRVLVGAVVRDVVAVLVDLVEPVDLVVLAVLAVLDGPEVLRADVPEILRVAAVCELPYVLLETGAVPAAVRAEVLALLPALRTLPVPRISRAFTIPALRRSNERSACAVAYSR